jgi:hypothetical protein
MKISDGGRGGRKGGERREDAMDVMDRRGNVKGGGRGSSWFLRLCFLLHCP